MVRVAEVALGMSALFFCQWKKNGGLPDTPTVNVAGLPARTAWFCGWTVMRGGSTWMARLWLVPALMATTLDRPRGMVIWPYVLSPQPTTNLLPSSASPWLAPAARPMAPESNGGGTRPLAELPQP